MVCRAYTNYIDNRLDNCKGFFSDWIEEELTFLKGKSCTLDLTTIGLKD